MTGEPILRARARPIGDVRAPATRRLIEQLVATMDAHDGLGLCAPQIGESKRVFVARDLHNRLADAEKRAPFLGEVHRARLVGERPTVVINPTVVSSSDEEEDDWEACLSIGASLHGLVRRPARINVRYTTETGETREDALEGYGARTFLHELDHLDGVLFLDRLLSGAGGLVHESALGHHMRDEED